jgi:hypothetical protein
VTQKEIATAEGICVRTLIRRNKKAKELAWRVKRALARAQALSSLKRKSNGPQRDANGRIIYTSIPPLHKTHEQSDNSRTYLIKESDSCHEHSIVLARTNARGPPS